ncbi:hypothetical protein BTVI_37810 [Pitangus sulphuratus]|nr:hypothetical protein BTVI_37810 [Pitangus sulphuratus]
MTETGTQTITPELIIAPVEKKKTWIRKSTGSTVLPRQLIREEEGEGLMDVITGEEEEARQRRNSSLEEGQPTESGKQLFGVPPNKWQKLLKEKVNRANLQNSKQFNWPWTLPNERNGQGFTSTLTCG